MSSTNDTFHHLFVKTRPKSILKKPPSPKCSDSLATHGNDCSSNTTELSTHQTEKNDMDKSESSDNHVCIINDNQKDISTISSIETPLTNFIPISNENLYQYEIDNGLIQTIPCADSSSSPTSNDEQQKCMKIKSKKSYYRPCPPIVTVTSSASSSDNDDERTAKRSVGRSKITVLRSDKHQQKDMQLDEFMRKYQQQGGIHLPTKEDHGKEQMTTENLINNDGNNYHQSPLTPQHNTSISMDSQNDDTLSLLESIDRITLSSKPLSPSQLLFDVARTNQVDRRTKIDRIRHYVEEQIGISAFLTIYKLIKSSQIPIDIREKPFCYYETFIPHLCCLIMLESEQQKNRL